MAITVTPLLTVISACDATTSWTGSVGITLDTDFYIEQTGSLSATVRTATRTFYYDFGGAGGTTTLQTTHIYVWMFHGAVKQLANETAGGLQIYVASTNGNTGRWYVGGGDTYPGGWKCFVVNTDRAFSATTGGNPTMTSIRYVGVAATSNSARNAINFWWDVMRFGSGLQITSASNDAITFNDIYNQDVTDTNAYGIVDKIDNTFFIQGELVFGSTSAGQHIAFSDADQIVVFRDVKVSSTLYKIQVLGNATGVINFQLGTNSGTGNDMIGLQGVTIKAANTSLPYAINFADANIDSLKLYGSTFINPSTVQLGSTTVELGGSSSSIDIVDCAFNNSNRITYNLPSAATKVENNNTIISNNDTTASIEIVNPNSLDGDDWEVVDQNGYKSYDDAVTETITLEDHNFAGNTRMVYINNNKTIDVINPTWTVTTTDQTDITFENATSNSVNEKFALALTVQTTSGSAISGARTYIFEGRLNNNLPADNKITTDTNGLAASNILTRTFVDNAGTSLTVTSYGLFALRIYRYTYTPYVSALTVTIPVTQSISLNTDAVITQTTQNTALYTAAGSVTVTQPTIRYLLLGYDGGSVKLTAGETVTGATSGHTATVIEVSGNATSGKVILNPTAAGNMFQENEALNGSTAGAGACNVDKATTNDSFAWLLDGNSTITMLQKYEFLAAHMAARRCPTAKMYDASPAGYTTYTTEAASLTTADVNLMPSSPATNDYFLFGDESTSFESITLNISTAAVTSTITWQYSSGVGAWTNLSGVSDGTTNFTLTGERTVTFTHPGAAWVTDTYDSVTAYWVRALQAHATPATRPIASTIWLDKIYETVHTWGESAQSQLLYSGGSGYYTSNAIRTESAVDACETTTGWSATEGNATVALNTTQFKQGSGGLNLYKTTTTGTTTTASKTTTSVDYTSTTLGFWVYCLSSTFLAKLAVTNCLEVRFGSDSSNYYYKRWNNADLAAGWNYLSFDYPNATGTTGTPTVTACDYTAVIVTYIATQTSSAGDFIYDDLAIYTGNPQGVYVKDRGAGTVAYFTADHSTTFTPATSTTLTVKGVVQNTQVFIIPTAGGTALLNTTATTVVSGNEYQASTAYTYITDVPVTVRAREMGYLPYESTGTITSTNFTATAVWQVDPNWKLVVSGVNIQFTNPATITRASGDFGTDGWLAVMGQVTVEGSASNNGTYTLATVGTTTITISGATLVNEGPSSGITLTFTRRSLT